MKNIIKNLKTELALQKEKLQYVMEKDFNSRTASTMTMLNGRIQGLKIAIHLAECEDRKEHEWDYEWVINNTGGKK